MKQKKNETIPMALVVVLLLICTLGAGGLALLAREDGFSFPELLPELSLEKIGFRQSQESESLSTIEEEQEDEAVILDENLHRIANTYGEIFGLLVSEGTDSLTADPYCVQELYQVDYSNGQVQVNSETEAFYWFLRNNVKCDEIKLTERELVSKAKEYFNILQLDRSYGNIARKVNREKNVITVVFQTVVDEDLELYSDFEAVKMVLSAQTGELISCKIFDLPLVEQEGQQIGKTAAMAAVQDQLSVTFSNEAEGELAVCSPIQWGDASNYTSRIVWKITADAMLYFVDAYSGSVLGQLAV